MHIYYCKHHTLTWSSNMSSTLFDNYFKWVHISKTAEKLEQFQNVSKGMRSPESYGLNTATLCTVVSRYHSSGTDD